MHEETRSAPGGPGAPGLEADAEDEALAAAARARYLTEGIASIEPDHKMRSALGSDEELLALRESVSIDRLPNGGPLPLSGRLAITTERLIMVNELPLTLAALDELDDVTLVADRLLVMLTSGAGFTIEAGQPRLLRVQLAEARARRADRQTGALSKTTAEPPSEPPRR